MATADDRYELLMARARACRVAADSDGQRSATAEAIRLASQAGDVERIATAAAGSSEGAFWSNRPAGEIDQPTLDALHRAEAGLPGADTALRCRVLLALSREMFWAPGHLAAEAYAEQGLAVARRLGDAGLRAWACHTLIVSTLRPATLEQRTQLTDESVHCARTAGDDESLAVGLFWRVVAAGEAGRVQQRDEDARAALELATQLRLRYLQVMIGGHQVPWLALHGRFDEADRLLMEAKRWAEHASFPFRDESIVAAHAFLEMWRGRAHELLADFAAVHAESPVDMGTALLLLLLRAGRLDDAAAQLDHRPIPLADDDFAAPLDLAIGAEAALLLRRPRLASEVYARMAPWSGRAASAGTGGPVGPVDAYLAMAAAAVGETGLAGDHADAAMGLCATWHMPPVADWLAGYRTRFNF